MTELEDKCGMRDENRYLGWLHPPPSAEEAVAAACPVSLNVARSPENERGAYSPRLCRSGFQLLTNNEGC